MFKKEEGLTYIAMIFIIIFIALIVFGAIYFVRMQISKEALETLKDHYKQSDGTAKNKLIINTRKNRDCFSTCRYERKRC